MQKVKRKEKTHISTSLLRGASLIEIVEHGFPYSTFHHLTWTKVISDGDPLIQKIFKIIITPTLVCLIVYIKNLIKDLRIIDSRREPHLTTSACL